jgi:hypothetical protein
VARRHCTRGRVDATALLGAADGCDRAQEESGMNEEKRFDEGPAPQPGETIP